MESNTGNDVLVGVRHRRVSWDGVVVVKRDVEPSLTGVLRRVGRYVCIRVAVSTLLQSWGYRPPLVTGYHRSLASYLPGEKGETSPGKTSGVVRVVHYLGRDECRLGSNHPVRTRPNERKDEVRRSGIKTGEGFI